MPIKKENKSKQSDSMGIHNFLWMVRKWDDNFKKGKAGEQIVYSYLAKQGCQVNPIIPWNEEKSATVYDDSHKEDTTFSPDFLICGDKGIFFADSKGKNHNGTLGWINKSDYDKYYGIMQGMKGIGFKLYFPIFSTKQIWVMNELIEPSDFPKQSSNSDNRVIYKIPDQYLENLGNY